MSDFAKFCPKCYAFFRDPDLYAKHVETCGFAKKTADSRRQTAAEEKKGDKQPSAKKTEKRGQEAEKVENSPVTVEEQSAADCGLPSVVSAEGGLPSAVASPHVKTPKFKT